MKRVYSQSGFSILEIVATVTLMSVMLAVAVSNLRTEADPLSLASTNLEAFIKQMRAKAISSTLAYTLSPSSNNRIQVKYSNKCSDATKTVDTKYFYNFPTTVTLKLTTWSVCYSSRGFPDSNIQIDIRNNIGSSATLEVMLGGAIRKL